MEPTPDNRRTSKKAPVALSAPRPEAIAGPAPRWASDVRGAGTLEALHRVNERCIELLVQAARADRAGAFPLAFELHHALQSLTPQSRARAASQAVLLVDVQFTNRGWWQAVRRHPGRASPHPVAPGSFPRASAVSLGRATLMLAWHSLRADERFACLLGMDAGVAEVIAGFPLTELDRILDPRYGHVRPRWEDRPAVWRQLLLSAEAADIRRSREASLRALQLVTGEVWAASNRALSKPP